jgi:hypothetical protein
MDYVDPQGYWLDPDRNIHRMSIPDPDGEQTIIATITPECSQAEWDLLREALQIVSLRGARSNSRNGLGTIPGIQFEKRSYETNSVTTFSFARTPDNQLLAARTRHCLC